jgi:flagellar hook-length control protein FliK
MTQIPSTLPTPPPARDPGRSPGDPPDAPFASVLEDEARTAVAEGRSRQTAAEGGGDAPTPIREDADAPTLAALLGGLPLPSGDAPQQAPPQQALPQAPGGATAAPSVAPTVEVPVLTGPAVAVAAGALPLAPASIEAGLVVASPQTATDGAAPGVLAAGSTGEQESAAARGASATTAAVPTAPTGQAAAGDGEPATERFEAGAAAPAAAAPGADRGSVPTAAPPAAAGGGQQAQATPPSSSSAPPPAATPAPPPAAAAAHGIRLAEAVETVKLAFRAAAERGVAHARIALSPRELGGIEIHLKQTADGLVARVVAEHQAAAQLLQHAGAELRRSLEGQGLTLLQLDVGTPGDERGRGAADSGLPGFANGTTGDGRGSGARAGQQDRATADVDDEEIVVGSAGGSDPTTLALPNGALVDVLA